MARPHAYKHSFVALYSIPYTAMPDAEHSNDPDGVVPAGQTVWADHLHQRHPSRATAFLDSVGVVSLDPRWLVTPELYQSAQR